MKLFINLMCFSLIMAFSRSAHAKSGIRVFYFRDHNKALIIYEYFKSIGIPGSLITLKQSETPCSAKAPISFLDVCVNGSAQMKVLRKTQWLSQTLKPFLKQELKDHFL